jgi:hypothetical protein
MAMSVFLKVNPYCVDGGLAGLREIPTIFHPADEPAHPSLITPILAVVGTPKSA